MEDYELVKKLSFTGKYRNELYLSPSKIENLYVQRVAQIAEIARSGSVKGGVSGNILSFLGAEVSGEKGLESKVAITPLLQAIIAENAARESKALIDLTAQAPRAGELARYIGPANITLMNNDLTQEKSGISAKACLAINSRRKIQEEILQFSKPNIRTVVMTFVAQNTVFAAIASAEFIHDSGLASYFNGPTFGILCMTEDILPEVTFLNPLWIWHEAS